jgi:signal transduction histidine kinase
MLRVAGYDLRRTNPLPGDDVPVGWRSYFRPVLERLGRTRVGSAAAQDAAIAVAVAALAEYECLSGQVTGPRAAAVPLALVMTLPLALRRRWPMPVLAVVMLSFVFQVGAHVHLEQGSLASVIAGLLAVYTVAAHSSRQVALFGAVFAYAVIAGTVLRGTGGLGWGLVLVGGAWAAGTAIGARHAQAEAAVERARELERERESLALQAVADERVRIARELHDVVTHSVSVMVVQAGAADQVLPPGGDQAREALAAIQTTGRQALRELRRLLGVLRTEDGEPTLGPQPGLAAVDEIAQKVRQAGTPVAVRVEGSARLPAGVDLAAFRIVQEALTNALKHAPGREIEVRIGYRSDALDIEVANAVARVNGVRQNGHGLIGMRERAQLYGGSVDAAADESGRFVVRAHLPLDAST